MHVTTVIYDDHHLYKPAFTCFHESHCGSISSSFLSYCLSTNYRRSQGFETQKWVLLFLHHQQLLWLFSLPLPFSASFLTLPLLKQSMQALQGTTSLMYFSTSFSFFVFVFLFTCLYKT